MRAVSIAFFAVLQLAFIIFFLCKYLNNNDTLLCFVSFLLLPACLLLPDAGLTYELGFCVGVCVNERDKKCARDSAGFGHFIFYLFFLSFFFANSCALNRYRYTADVSSVEKK